MKSIILVFVALFVSTILCSAGQLDILEFDVSTAPLYFWYHYNGHLMWQVFGCTDFDDMGFTLGPNFQLGFLNFEIPLGPHFNLGEKVEITHWHSKINAIGSYKNFDCTFINDYRWGVSEHLDQLFIKEQIIWKSVGVRLEGFREEPNPLPLHLGPVLRYKFKGGPSQIHLYYGVDINNNKNQLCKLNLLIFV